MLPKAVRDLTQELTKLPGVGPKTAERLALHLLRQPPNIVGRLADTIKELHGQVKICRTCYNLSEEDICTVCASPVRDRKVLCVVEDALDIEAIERTQAYDGLYHVLGGVLSPLDGIGPEQLTLNELLERVQQEEIAELIVALDHTLESEATVRHISSHLKDTGVAITRLARGLPTGGDIEFADALTLTAAMKGRKNI